MTEKFIFDVMDKFNTSSIVDLELSCTDLQISLKKKEASKSEAKPEALGSAAPKTEVKSSSENQTEKTEVSAEEKTEIKKADESQTLKSPIVGTFYRSPSPDSPAYAEKGTVIKKGEPVCIIEAMKMMNTLNADYDFEVVDVLAENGNLVEFDQPLFAIKKL